MSRRGGSADLPLHGGCVPRWLGERMTRLGTVMCEAIVHTYGRDELLRRLAHPFWFQSFGAVMGMDWHSSGITTSVMGALKRGLTPLSGELGIHVCGGRGRHSRATPAELLAVGDGVGLDGAALARASRLVAKVDSAAVQDGFDLYLHSFVVSDEGRWVVVQQGMNGKRKQARRYHWLSEGLSSFVDAPHAAIDGPQQGNIVNLADHRAAAAREAQVVLLQTLAPERLAREWQRIDAAQAPVAPAVAQAPVTGDLFAGQGWDPAQQPHLSMPDHHDVRSENVITRRLHASLAAAAECGPADFTALLQVPGVGARTVRSLAMVAEVLHGTPCRFSDPARFSLAHGGKDRHPFPVPTRVFDHTIGVLKQAMQQARLGNEERLQAIARLDAQARWLEASARGPSVEAYIAQERVDAHRYGGAACSVGSRRLRSINRLRRRRSARQANERATAPWQGGHRRPLLHLCVPLPVGRPLQDRLFARPIGPHQQPASALVCVLRPGARRVGGSRARTRRAGSGAATAAAPGEHNAPAPMAIRSAAGGHTEWFRGVGQALEVAVAQLEQQGYRVFALQAWLQAAMAQRIDRLYDWSLVQLSQDELDGVTGPTATQQMLRDVLDGYRALELPLRAHLPGVIWDWYCRSA